MSRRIATVVGARPQFIKAGPVSRALRDGAWDETLIHTGQHYDSALSDVFFRELGLPSAHVELRVGSGPPGWQVGQMLARLGEVFRDGGFDAVLVYGDTNSTLAGALAASQLNIPVAHVEAGLRSFNRTMPEELNRVITDHCASFLFCPTPNAVANLRREGITEGVHLVGDPMADAIRIYACSQADRANVLERLSVSPGKYTLATIHRAYNTDDPARLQAIMAALNAIDGPVVVPLHPRTKKALEALGYSLPDSSRLILIEPVGYFDMIRLERDARLILTDSGGVQKEAFLLGVPCLTLRPETEWMETVAAGWNQLVDADPERIVAAARSACPPSGPRPSLYGDGFGSREIVAVLEHSVA